MDTPVKVKKKRKLRGNMFKDPFEHDRHHGFLKAKAQAMFRKEEWKLSIFQWFKIWHDPAMWYNRGRASDSVTLTRVDPTEPWCVENVIIMTRRKQLQKARQYDIDNGRRYRK
jgi:hypothetical protein